MRSQGWAAKKSADFMRWLQILPLVGLRAFEMPKTVATPIVATSPASVAPSVERPELDTIVVPAQQDGFDKVFLGQNCWYAIRIAGGMLHKIKYIAAYQTQPHSQVTYYAPVANIEAYGEEGKYKLNFAEPAKPIGPIPFADAPQGSMQGPRYTSFKKLQTAKRLMDLF